MQIRNFRFLFIVSILVALKLSCDKYEPIPNSPKERSFRDIGIDEIPEIEAMLSKSLAFYKSLDENRFQVNDANSILDLEIDWSKIVELVDTLGNTNYSIAIKDEVNAPYTFHNLVVGKTPEGDLKKPFLMTYIMSPEFRDIYDQTLSIQGFTGIAKKRFINFNSNSEGNSSAPFSLGSTSSNDPCPRETQVDNDGPGPSGGGSGGGGGGGGGGAPDAIPDEPGGSYSVCYSYWIDFPSESCGYNCVTAPRSILVTDCQSYSYSSSDTDPCDESDEIAVIDPNKPCPGDPVKNPKIAPQTYSLVKGARFGNDARKKWNKDKTLLIDKAHYGLDLEINFGDPIFSSFDGVIDAIGNDQDGWGYWVRVKSNVNGQTVFVLYAHLDSYSMNALTSGNIAAGTILGFAGTSGNLATALKNGTAIQHLHIEVRVGSTWNTAVKKNPEDYLSTKFDSNGNFISNCLFQ